MSSKTEIANRALSKMGSTRTSNVDTENSKKANTIRYMWDIERRALLAKYPWNFAVKPTQLAKEATTDDWEFKNKFQLPSDFLQLLKVQEDPKYKIQGKYIYTDVDAPLKIKYVRDVTNAGDFPPLFAEAFAAKLAVEGVEEITQSNTKKQILIQEYRAIIGEAYAVNDIQNPPEEKPVDTWLLSRDDALDDIDYNL